MKPFCENNSSFMRTSERASFERTLPGANAWAVLMASRVPRMAMVNSTT
jgi:hypothetical protein